MPRDGRARPRRHKDSSWPDLPEFVAQRLPRARQARLHGADSNAEGVCNLFVAEAVDLAEHDHRALIERQVVERRPQALCQLLARVGAVGGGVIARLAQIAVGKDVLIEGNLVGLVTPPPPSLPVTGLVDADAVNPSLESRLAAEIVNGAKDAEEDFLREVEGFVAVAEEVQGELEHHPFVAGHELSAGGRLTGGAAFDQRRLAVSDLYPSECA